VKRREGQWAGGELGGGLGGGHGSGWASFMLDVEKRNWEAVSVFVATVAAAKETQ